VAPVADRPTASSFTDVVSPELALVDPTLRAAAREWLEDPDDTLARLAATVRVARRPAAEPDAAEEAAVRRLAESALAAEAAAETVEPSALPLPRRLPRLTVVVAAASAGFAIALLVADRALDRDQGRVTAVASVTTQPVTETEPAATAGPARRPLAPSKPSTPGATARPVAPQRFAWAPVTGATGYHVELHRDGRRVFAADTTGATVTVPSRWTFAGRRYRLEAVEYRWYVWPIVSGRRTPKAVVQARLVVRNR
jgi:hypothetical protein